MPQAASATIPTADAMPLPMPSQLARLGTVLCLYRAGAGGELGGWSRAVRARAGATLHSDGPDECIAFRDATGDDCWKLYLLPDSDFLAWERLAARLPPMQDERAGTGIGERLLQKLSARIRNGPWQASVLKLHALCVDPGMSAHAVLAASLVPASPLGTATARRIALGQGADATSLTDDCCCLRAARHSGAPLGNEPYPLVRLPGPGNAPRTQA